MILPQSALSGSMLISSGSRLSQELLLSLTDIGEVDILVKKLRENSTLS
jgi:hypothetical protein